MAIIKYWTKWERASKDLLILFFAFLFLAFASCGLYRNVLHDIEAEMVEMYLRTSAWGDYPGIEYYVLQSKMETARIASIIFPTISLIISGILGVVLWRIRPNKVRSPFTETS